MDRRAFIFGLGAALITAPAIVRAASLMPVKQMLNNGVGLYNIEHPYSYWGTAADLTEESLLQAMIEIKKSFEPESFRLFLRNSAPIINNLIRG
jgi:hypothetical protein